MIYQLQKARQLLLTDGCRYTANRVAVSIRSRVVSSFRRLKVRYVTGRFLLEKQQRIAEAIRAEPETYLYTLKQKTLSYVASNHLAALNAGAYSFRVGGQPLLYASCYAALVRDLFDDLRQLSEEERRAWIDYIAGFQCEDGLFRDTAIACMDADLLDWWGWRHLTLHALMALNALGGVAIKPLKLLDRYRSSGEITHWLDSRNWQFDACNVSNEIQNIGTFLQYARDYQGAGWCQHVLEEIYDWLDARQDPSTGYWGYGRNSRRDISMGVQTGYHLWCLFFTRKRSSTDV